MKTTKTLHQTGYTLIELLVVIAIIAILGVVAFVNYQTFAQDQILNRAIGQIQSALRLTQSNATSGVVCIDSANNTYGGVSWSIQFTADRTKIHVYCEKSTIIQKVLQLENVEVNEIQGLSCPSPSSAPVTVSYSPLFGILTFEASDSCIAISSKLTITLRNLKNANTKSFSLSKGGAIDVE